VAVDGGLQRAVGLPYFDFTFEGRGATGGREKAAVFGPGQNANCVGVAGKF